ncbi:Lysine histidine transporter 1 [Platanthera zijinensis]|uniref:Lysine histidine transporter 1 n=1 Tax=Platanthera zijinensis TaxID=2320716 RepID=A0AAP0G5M1_9ASPA
MDEKHEMVLGKWFDRYHELNQHASGERLGLYIVVPQQLIWEVGMCIVYMLTSGKSLKKFHDTVCLDCMNIELAHLFYNDIRIRSFRVVAAPQLQFHIRHLCLVVVMSLRYISIYIMYHHTNKNHFLKFATAVNPSPTLIVDMDKFETTPSRSALETNPESDPITKTNPLVESTTILLLGRTGVMKICERHCLCSM